MHASRGDTPRIPIAVQCGLAAKSKEPKNEGNEKDNREDQEEEASESHGSCEMVTVLNEKCICNMLVYNYGT
jgi:hypothetical protein